MQAHKPLLSSYEPAHHPWLLHACLTACLSDRTCVEVACTVRSVSLSLRVGHTCSSYVARRLPKLRRLYLDIYYVIPVALEMLLSTIRRQMPDLACLTVAGMSFLSFIATGVTLIDWLDGVEMFCA
jgi:hypothetical protein